MPVTGGPHSPTLQKAINPLRREQMLVRSSTISISGCSKSVCIQQRRLTSTESVSNTYVNYDIASDSIDLFWCVAILARGSQAHTLKVQMRFGFRD